MTVELNDLREYLKDRLPDQLIRYFVVKLIDTFEEKEVKEMEKYYGVNHD